MAHGAGDEKIPRGINSRGFYPRWGRGPGEKAMIGSLPGVRLHGAALTSPVAHDGPRARLAGGGEK